MFPLGLCFFRFNGIILSVGVDEREERRGRDHSPETLRNGGGRLRGGYVGIAYHEIKVVRISANIIFFSNLGGGR